MDDKELKEYTKSVLNNSLSNIEKKILICSVYLSKYINDNDKDAYNNFVLMFKNLDYKEKIQVLNNVKTNIKEEEKIKVKTINNS